MTDRSKTRVINVKLHQRPEALPNYVYVGRPSKWGNPFSHLDGTLARHRVATREEAVAKYEEWIRSQPELLASVSELKGKTLGCWCHPKACHAHVLARLAEEA